MNEKIRFIVVGIANTAITFAFYAGLVHLGLHHNLALAIVYPIGIALSFVLNLIWTFKSSDDIESVNASETANQTQLHASVSSKFVKYTGVYLVHFLVNLSLLNALIYWAGLGPIPAQLLAIIVSTAVSFVLQKHWVFKTR